MKIEWFSEKSKGGIHTCGYRYTAESERDIVMLEGMRVLAEKDQKRMEAAACEAFQDGFPGVQEETRTD